MTVEPMGSAMAYQAQPTTRTQVQPVAEQNTEVPVDGQTVNVDTTTAAVSQAQGKDSDSSGNTQGDNAYQAQWQVSNEQLKEAIADMNKKISNTNKEAVFGIHEETNRVMIKIVDKDTKEVLKEYPPEKTLDMIAKVWEMAGLLVDEKR